jgi:hypothetical protein
MCSVIIKVTTHVCIATENAEAQRNNKTPCFRVFSGNRQSLFLLIFQIVLTVSAVL